MSESKSEDHLAQKVDVCVADTSIKIVGGLVTGAILSLFLFKRKTWPIALGMGIGAGMGYSNCENKMSMPFMVKADRVKVKVNTKELPPEVAVEKVVTAEAVAS